jgi:hypothetical protein
VSEGLSSLPSVGTDRRVRRVLELGQALIDAPRGIVLERYARDHGYSRSSAYRDLDVLRDIGFMITSDGGRHRVAASFRYFGHRGLDPDELLALFVARNVAGRIPGSRFDRALGALWAKLTADGRQPSLTPDRDGTLTVAAFQTIDYGPKREIIDTIDRGIADRVAIHITHRKTNGQVSQRIVEPGQLHAEASLDSLFLIGWVSSSARRPLLRGPSHRGGQPHGGEDHPAARDPVPGLGPRRLPHVARAPRRCPRHGSDSLRSRRGR